MSKSEAPGNVPLGELLELAPTGAALPFAVLDAQGRLLLAAGKLLQGTGQLQALLERGGCVHPVEAQAAREAHARAAVATAAAATASADSAAGPAVRRLTWFDRMERQVWLLDELLRGLQRGSLKAPQIEAHADAYIALVERHFDAALYLCLRQDDRRVALFALTHSMHTATVGLLTARQLGWAPAAQRRVVLAALTMNLSIVELQARMAEQSEPPSQRQMAQIRAHPLQSAQILRSAGVDDAEWLGAVEQHHERAGGSGYPQGLPAVQPLGHLLRVADVFTAKLSPRSVRAPLTPQVAARQLYQEEQGGPMAAGLIRALGVYPPGDFVVLKNGDSGIVLHRGVPGRAAVVVSLFAANGKPVAGSPRRDTGLAEFAITGAIPGQASERGHLPRVLPEQVYGLLDAELPAA